MSDDIHSQTEERLADYHSGRLSREEHERIAQHLTGCQRCQNASTEALEVVNAIGQMIPAATPAGLQSQIEDKIRTRSGGRFFGRKAFGDRVPFELVALLLLGLGLALLLIIRCSPTDSLHYDREKKQAPPPSAVE